MRGREGWCRGGLPPIAVAVLALAPTLAGAGADGSNVRLSHVVEKAVLVRALDGAARKLAAPECQALLDEFESVSGQSLRGALQASGLSAPEYLDRIFFYDAPPRLCEHSALASTLPQSRVVFVCGARFVRQMRRDPSYAEATLIHEVLHSLGLGENPPSADYISERVRVRCGR